MKAFFIYLINSERPKNLDDVNVQYVVLNDQSELLSEVERQELELCHATYFVIDSNVIVMKNKLMRFSYYQPIDDILEFINVPIYRNMTGDKAYKTEMMKDHIGRKGYFLLLEDNGKIIRYCVSWDRDTIFGFDTISLDDILKKTTILDWNESTS